MADEIPDGLSKDEVNRLMEAKVKEAYAALAEAAGIAEKYRVILYFDFAGRGAIYFPEPEIDEDGNFVDEQYEWLEGDYGWRSSSSLC
jgi:hypothetical protein